MSIEPNEARSIIRKSVKRVPEGEEIRHLNIMPMMDIMTILLVAFIFQAAVGAAAVAAGSVNLPTSASHEPKSEAATLLIITPEAIVVEEEEIVAVRNGDVDASQKEGGAMGLKIPRLTQFLGAMRRADDAERVEKGEEIPALPELMIIADRSIPYRLLISVIFSAKQREAGFKKFRLIVLSEEGGPHTK